MLQNDFSAAFEETTATVNCHLRVHESFDLIVKRQRIGGRRAAFYFTEGLIKDAMLEWMLEFFCSLSEKQVAQAENAQAFLELFVTSPQAGTETSLERFSTAVLSGAVGLIVEGLDKAMIIDPRVYPARAMREPDNDRLLRGSHEGFLESVLSNTALIRRRIRNVHLTFRQFQIGSSSNTDVVLCYIDGLADENRLSRLTKRLEAIDVPSLTMGQESLRECLLPTQPWNPFPRFRHTERPDTAAACLNSGNILLLVDGSPSAMIVPTGIFDYVQDTNDYCFPPMLGTFFRYMRSFVFFLSMMFVPVWYLLQLHEASLPEWTYFIFVNEPNGVSIFLQLVVSEFIIDTLRLASLNTPSVLSNSFAVVGALVLGEFGVSSGIFVPEVVLFMAFSAISNFTQSSYELGFAIKGCRMLILLLTFLFDVWGFAAGVLIVLAVIATTRTIDGYTYLYPLLPFDKQALVSLLVRRQLRPKK
ncbi:MAG: spore germination protein [Clostridia bacterium]|nr:spore germination protein [Clostridia bacterium]